MRARLTAGLLAILLLLTAGCGGEQEQTALQFDHSLTLEYARQYTVDYYQGGYALVTIGEDSQYLVIPEGKDVPEGVSGDTVLLRQPMENLYLVSTSVMDFFCKLDALDAIALSGTDAGGWYIPQAREAIERGKITYAGKYSAPDYERILASDCGLAVENTMIYHTPEVKEELERLGVPVLVERSSYESDPLGRMEWIKLYGLLLGKEQEAGALFAEAEAQLQPILSQSPTGTSAAFFSITSNGLATVRKSGDYVAKMIEMAGGTYVFGDLEDNGNNLSTMNLPLENFYAGAKGADVLIYNSTIEGTVETIDQLLEKCPILEDFQAVQTGRVYCTSQSLFQQTMELGGLILDMHQVFTEENPGELNYLTRVQ